MIRQSNLPRRGAAILSVLLALVIIFILMGMYFQPVATVNVGGGVSKPWAVYTLDRTRDTVCNANQRTMMTTLIQEQITWGARATNDPVQMQQTARKLAKCPGDGALYVCEEEVFCTQHTGTQMFREALGLL